MPALARTEPQSQSVISLVPEFQYTATLRPPVPIGHGPWGERVFFGANEGTVQGDRLRGTALEGGGDWLVLGDDGFGRMDVRAQFRTDDGANIYLRYVGLIEVTPAARAALGGGDTGTEFGDPYFVTAPRLETGDRRYSWVNQTAFVAVGRVNPGPVVEYHVSRVEVGGASA